MFLSHTDVPSPQKTNERILRGGLKNKKKLSSVGEPSLLDRLTQTVLTRNRPFLETQDTSSFARRKSEADPSKIHRLLLRDSSEGGARRQRGASQIRPPRLATGSTIGSKY